MVIEHDVSDVPDRQVQLAEGFPDFARGPVGLDYSIWHGLSSSRGLGIIAE
jgi:hypothetical protein